MDTLPLEVTREIFHQAIEKNDLSRPPYSPVFDLETDSIPLTLSHVSHLWRNVTLSSGLLWSYLSLEFVLYHGILALRKKFELFETCLRRTESCPLNFSLCTSSYIGGEDLGDEEIREAKHMTNCVIERLLSEQHRWQDVSFQWKRSTIFPNSLGNNSLGNVVADNMPLLRSLFLSFYPRDEDERPLQITIDLTRSTLLECLRVDGNFHLRFGDEPLQSLTETSSLEFPMAISSERVGSTCLSFLRAAPNLKKFHIVHNSPKQARPITPSGESQGFVLRDLQSLSCIEGMMPFTNEEVSFPSLTALRTFDVQYVVDCVAHFKPSLTFLDIGEEMDSQSLINTLKNLPMLRTLRTKFVTASELEAVMGALMHFTGSDADWHRRNQTPNANFYKMICPLLSMLRVDIQGMTGDEWPVCISAVQTMLKIRKAFLNTFRRIRLPDKYEEVLELPLTDEDFMTIFSRILIRRVILQGEGDAIEPDPFDWYLLDE